MKLFDWSRKDGYQVSSKGDKRFSALNALMPDGRTIEAHYQCDVKGYNPGGRNWQLGKGKPPLNSETDLWSCYLGLWRHWAISHPELIAELKQKAIEHNYMLADFFASTGVNQARALSHILNEQAIVPQLASDIDLNKLTFPLWGQPKIDGVRTINLTGIPVGRSLESHANSFVTEYYRSNPFYVGLDGEMYIGRETDYDLCMRTSSLLNTQNKNELPYWAVFDYVTPDTIALTYSERYELLIDQVKKINDPRIHLVPVTIINSAEELLAFEDKCLSAGYEGAIYRNPDAVYKSGRSGKLLELTRLKRFITEEALVLSVEEGRSNNNAAKKNALGRTERSTHKENMTPNGKVGSITARLLKDIYDQHRPDLCILKKGTVFTVAPGKMKEDERIDFWLYPEKIVNKIIKFDMFPKGIKDLPRFPTFNSIRITSDIGKQDGV